ncbi:MAG: DUF2752 domain-containing protein [Chthoniobacteraceae bacterium]
MPSARADNSGFAAALLRQRPLCLAIVGAVGAHLAATAIGVPGWICPWNAATGLPCPGCGLTRASVQLLSGDFSGSMRTHPFAPAVVIALGFVLAGAVLADGARERMLSFVARLDAGGRSSAVLLAALIAFWVVRMMLDAGG